MLLVTAKTGWIGIDVGTATVKVVQLRYCDDQWKWLAAAVVPRRAPWPEHITTDAQVESSRDELSAVNSLLPMLRGHRAAAILPMTVCDVHAINRAIEDDPKSATTIRRWVEVATQQAVDSWEIRSWPVLRGSNGGGDWTGAVTLLRPWGDRLCDDIARTGWSCQLIDALPFAMARAAAMVCNGDRDVPLAVLDWGYQRATLCIVMDGRPAYVRCLKNCGFSRVNNSLIQKLGIDTEEATSLVTEHGLPAPAVATPSEARLVVQELISAPLGDLVAEIARSIEHFGYQRRMSLPEEIILMGGGATLHGLPEYLEQQTGLRSQRWELGEPPTQVAGAKRASQCLFGAAAALSALASSLSPCRGQT
jgi:Tfp pilus assembly PilM family ATPase